MELRILAPGIDCKTTNYGIAARIVPELMDRFFYDEEFRKGVITLHFGNEERCTDIYAKEGVALIINGKKYCVPDAVSIVTELICEKFFDE